VTRIHLAFLTAAVLWQAPALAGQIFFSNLVQPGNQYGPDPLGIGHTPSFPPGDTGEIFGATGFTATTDFRLTSIDIALGYALGFPGNGPNQADVFLMSDSGGLPSSVIESWHLTGLPALCGPCPLTTIASVSNPVLSAGDAYWVVASGGEQTFDLWSFTLTGNSFSPFATKDIQNGVDSGWLLDTVNGRQGALVVSGAAVPEPTSWTLTVSLLPAILVPRLRRRVLQAFSSQTASPHDR